MIILGIDPGYAIVGYGVIEFKSNRFSVVDYGAITTNAGTPFERPSEQHLIANSSQIAGTMAMPIMLSTHSKTEFGFETSP